jgi:hypothetical protein
MDPWTFTMHERKAEAPKGAIYFDSLSEARHYVSLLHREKRGEIRNLKRQVDYPLCAPRFYGGEDIITVYRADFQYVDVATGEKVIEDRKSPATKTALYRIKKKWLQTQYNIIIKEV